MRGNGKLPSSPVTRAGRRLLSTTSLVAIALSLISQDAHQPVIPKSINHANDQTVSAFALQEVFDLAFRSPDRGEVKLIGSERQLRDPVELSFRRFLNLDPKLKSFDKILQGERTLTELLPLRVFPIQPGATLVFFR